jgi:hypothetical protein
VVRDVYIIIRVRVCTVQTCERGREERVAGIEAVAGTVANPKSGFLS